MPTLMICYRSKQSGFTLMELMVTLILLAFGLIALVNLQMKLHMTELESFQRGQAVILVQDMVERMQMAGLQASPNPYVTGTASPVGTASGPDTLQNCSALTAAALDLCEWGNILKGASEVLPDDGDPNTDEKAGAMIGARGCIEELQAPDTTPTVCRPGRYRVTVVWQGMHQTIAPSVACAQNLYGDEKYRRAVATELTIGLPQCI